MKAHEFVAVLSNIRLSLPDAGAQVEIEHELHLMGDAYLAELRLWHYGEDNLGGQEDMHWYGPKCIVRVADMTEQGVLDLVHTMWIAYVTHEARERFSYKKDGKTLYPFNPHERELKV